MKATRREKEWFDNESLWRETYFFLFPESLFVSAIETVDKALTLLEPQGKAALDLCCGPGRCSIALAKRGFTVTGVDRTPFLLNKAKGRARTDRVKVDWVLKDMRDFTRTDTYDIALSIFTSFGYFEDPRQDVAVLRNVFASLRPGGAFLIDMNGKEVIARKFLPSQVDEKPDGTQVIERRQVQDGWTRMHNDWIVVKNGKARRFEFKVNVYSGQEIRDRLEEVGFVDVKLYGNLEGAAYNVNATRLVVVARKPGK